MQNYIASLFLCIIIIIAGAGDYASVSRLLTFSPGSGSQQLCTNITIQDDSVLESDEIFLVELEVDREHVEFNFLNTATVLITNDDSKKLQ